MTSRRGCRRGNSVSLAASRLRLAARLRRASKLIERQIRDYTTPAGTRIQNDLVRTAEHTFHRFEIHALAGDVRSLLVLLVDFQESRCLTGCLGHRLRFVRCCGLRALSHTPARLRYDTVGICLRLID